MLQATDSQGRTPAQVAAESGNSSLAAYLQQEAQRLGQAEELEAIIKSVSPANSGSKRSRRQQQKGQSSPSAAASSRAGPAGSTRAQTDLFAAEEASAESHGSAEGKVRIH